MIIKFSEIYHNLISHNSHEIPRRWLTLKESSAKSYSEYQLKIPKEYEKKFIHTPNGFVANYCEEY